MHEFNVKVQKLTYNALEIRNLIDKAKENADDTLLEILFKWQYANDAIISQKPPSNLDYDSIISYSS